MTQKVSGAGESQPSQKARVEGKIKGEHRVVKAAGAEPLTSFVPAGTLYRTEFPPTLRGEIADSKWQREHPDTKKVAEWFQG